MDGLDGLEGRPHQGLVRTVMAALSERSRRSMHPADLRQLAEAARRVAMAVETEFSLSERYEPRGRAAAPASAFLSQTYE